MYVTPDQEHNYGIASIYAMWYENYQTDHHAFKYDFTHHMTPKQQPMQHVGKNKRW